MIKAIKKSANIIIPYTIVTLLLIFIVYWFQDWFSLLLTNPESIKDYISSFGIYAPIIYIILNIIQVLLFFLPGAILHIAAGYAFGTFWGSIYAWIGLMLGSSIIFFLGRKFGRPFVERIIKKESLDDFDSFFNDRVVLALLVSRTIPIGFPSDVASLAVSLSPISYPAFLIATAIGYIPHIIIMVSFGDHITKGFTYSSVIIFSVIGFLVMIYLLYKPIKQQLEHKKHKKEEYRLSRLKLNDILKTDPKVETSFQYILGTSNKKDG